MGLSVNIITIDFMPIVFAAFSPHPPIILPEVGSEKDRLKVKNTIANLEDLGRKLAAENPDRLIISAPHRDWGFNVPLFFLAKNFLKEKDKEKIEYFLTGIEAPDFYFREGKRISRFLENNKKYALVASGDMSHCLKKDGPYGFHPDGPKFDQAFIEALKNKDMEKIINLDNIYPGAAECGLRSFCFLLGILEGAKISPAAKSSGGINWEPEILSYEGPFGVGYLVAELKISSKISLNG